MQLKISLLASFASSFILAMTPFTQNTQASIPIATPAAPPATTAASTASSFNCRIVSDFAAERQTISNSTTSTASALSIPLSIAEIDEKADMPDSATTATENGSNSSKKLSELDCETAADEFVDLDKLKKKKEASENLIKAAYYGNWSEIDHFINQGADINYQDPTELWTPLMCGAVSGHYAVVHELLKYKPNLELQSKEGSKAFTLALVQGYYEIALIIINAGASSVFDAQDPLYPAILLQTIHDGKTPIIIEDLINLGIDLNYQIPGTGTTPLIEAIEVNNQTIALKLIAHKADITLTDKHKRTPLMHAALRGQGDIVAALIKAGAPLDASDSDGNTALSLAVLHKKAGIIDQLITAGANSNPVLKDGMTLLQLALNNGNSDVIKRLAQAGTNLNVLVTNSQQTPLTHAIAHHNNALVRTLIESGAQLELRDATGLTPLATAAGVNNLEACQLLLAAGADINGVSAQNYTALMQAILHRASDELLFLLLSKNPRLDIRANTSTKTNGETALIIASRTKQHATVEALLAAGARINQAQANHETALIAAIRNHDDVLVTILLKAGAEKNAQNQTNVIPLIIAIQVGCDKIAQILLEAGANPNLENVEGFSILTLAAAYGRTEIVKLLIQKGAMLAPAALTSAAYNGQCDAIDLLIKSGIPVNVQDVLGMTALHYAAQLGRTAAVQRLIFHKADIKLKNSGHEAPILLAARHGHHAVVQVLIKEGADIREKDQLGRPQLLNTALVHGHAKVTQLLIDASGHTRDNQSDINCVDTNGDTPIITAARFGQIASVQALIQAGVSAQVKNKSDETALMAVFRQPTDQNLVQHQVIGPVLRQAREHSAKTAAYLLKYGVCDADAQDKEGKTALMYACEANAVDGVAVLMTKTNLQLKNKHGYSIYQLCHDGTAKKAQIEMSDPIKEVIQAAQYKLHEKLISAIKEANYNNFKKAAKEARNLCLTDKDGNNLLHVAIQELPNMSLQTKYIDFETALRFNQLIKIIGFIVSYCPKLLTRPNNKKKTPLDLAIHKQSKIKMLLEAAFFKDGSKPLAQMHYFAGTCRQEFDAAPTDAAAVSTTCAGQAPRGPSCITVDPEEFEQEFLTALQASYEPVSIAFTGYSTTAAPAQSANGKYMAAKK